jgi:hypothetical protein
MTSLELITTTGFDFRFFNSFLRFEMKSSLLMFLYLMLNPYFSEVLILSQNSMKPIACLSNSILFVVISAGLAYGQWKYEPTPENLKTREWFQDAKFGLFIHWGVYSVLGDGEWVMNQQQIPVKTYEKIPSFLILLISILRPGYKWRRMRV